LIALTENKPVGIILLDGLTGEQSAEMQQEVAALTKAPIYSPHEGNAILADADLILTTHEMTDWSKRQIFLPLLPPVGVAGMIDVMHKMVRLVERFGTRGGILYV